MKAAEFVRAQARRVCTLFTIALLLPAWAQAAEMTVGKAIHHDTSPPLSEMAIPAAALDGNKVVPIMERDEYGRYPDLAEPDGGLAQPAAPSLGPTPAPNLSVSGLSEQDNVNTVGFAVVPPDVNGDIGLDDAGNRIYIQYINSVWGVFDVTGNLIHGPSAGNSFWAGFGGPCEANNDGDPVVLYDDDAGQWFFSQFSIGEGVQCVAVSTTSDPLGPWHRYAFQVTPGGSNDYPKLGVWTDGAGQSAYTFTTRDFGGAGGSFSVGAGVMERDAMLVGAPAQFIKFINPCTGLDCVEGQLPPHLAGPPPPADTCPTFWTAVDAAYDDSPYLNDGYRNHTLCVDWANLSNSTYIEGPLVVAGSNFDRFLGNGFSDCISPVNGGEVLDCLALFTMYRAQYRWFGDNAHVVLNTTVDAGGDRAGIRWAETRSADGDSGWFLQQDGTYAPADGADRWMGSIAQDQSGNIALGFSITSSSRFPSVAYTSRMAGDAPGTMPGGEVTCHEGTGAQLASANRWGDYSSMSVDPTDDCTFWYTQEYYEKTGSFDFNTRICSFRFPDCGGPPNDPPVVTIIAPTDGDIFGFGASVSFSGTAVDTEDGDITISLQWTSSIDGSIGTGGSFSSTDLSAGNHTITAAATDSGGGTGSASVAISIVNQSPTVEITAPTDGSSFVFGAEVSFSGTASDPEDGNITANLQWTSSIDDSIGTGGSFSSSGLSVGNHTITASATDLAGATGTDEINLTINPPPATSVRVASVETGTLNVGKGNKRGTATVTVVNNLGDPVAGYDVSGEFGGSFNELVSGGPTNALGQVTLQTSAILKGGVEVTFCVTNIDGALDYDWESSAPGTTCGEPPAEPICGNNVKEIGEECDGTDLGGQSCLSLTEFDGPLGCFAPPDANACTFDTSGCVETPSCGLPGTSCTDDSECCSNKCKGKPGARTCN